MSSRHLVRVARLAALALAGFAVATPAGAEVVKVGMVNSLTGPHSSFDLPASEGVAMAFDELNKRGGITVKGKKYTFSLVSKCTIKPEFAVSGAQRCCATMTSSRVRHPDQRPSVPPPLLRTSFISAASLMDTLLGKPGFELAFHAGCGRHRRQILFRRREAARGVEGRHSAAEQDVSRSIAVYKPLLEQAGISVPMVECFPA
jgi:hypothetical protein